MRTINERREDLMSAEQDKAVVRRFVEEALIEARVQSELYELLLRWIEALPPRMDGRPENPEVVASVVSWAIFGAGLQWGRNGASRPAEETAGQVLSVIVEGLDGSVSLPARTP
jgi:hypothetical protein